MKQELRIATRSSQLALWQAEWVSAQIRQAFPQVQVTLVQMKTQGDKILDTPLAKIGGKGLFVKELEVAMLEGRADLAVHSMKDVPIELPEGLEISVITKREEPGDALVSNRHKSFAALPQGAVVGTSSLRRMAQLKQARPDLRFESLRGNVNTRLAKLDQGQFDAIILAAAGLIRLGFAERIAELLPFELSLPSIGQGAVGIESRKGDEEVLQCLRHLIHPDTTSALLAERALLTRLNGGCQVPLAGFAQLQGEALTLTGLIASPEGDRLIRFSKSGLRQDGPRLGVALAEELLAAGGREILAQVGIETH